MSRFDVVWCESCRQYFTAMHGQTIMSCGHEVTEPRYAEIDTQ